MIDVYKTSYKGVKHDCIVSIVTFTHSCLVLLIFIPKSGDEIWREYEPFLNVSSQMCFPGEGFIFLRVRHGVLVECINSV